MTKQISFSIFALCIVTLVQEFGFARLALFEAMPDALAVFIAFLAVTQGQKTSTSFGFAAGILAGIFSGNLGLHTLAITTGGFLAGYFHSPEDSHATAKQKTRRFYVAVLTAEFSSHTIITSVYNPLGLSPEYRIVTLGLLASLLSLTLAFIANRLILRKTFAS
ncbi:MAG: rod shape-determining protein MreD [Chlorobium sp.]|nr:MAG: rod shape-determining protein MreD [Chlorobium sp.]